MADDLKIKVKAELKKEQVEATLKYLTAYKKSLYNKFVPALESAAKILLGKANFLCPYDPMQTGKGYIHLRDTGKVQVSGGGNKTQSFVTYSKPYAVFVHEDLTAKHGNAYNQEYADRISKGLDKNRRPQEQAKWLEAAKEDPATKEWMKKVVRKYLSEVAS